MINHRKRELFFCFLANGSIEDLEKARELLESENNR